MLVFQTTTKLAGHHYIVMYVDLRLFLLPPFLLDMRDHHDDERCVVVVVEEDGLRGRGDVMIFFDESGLWL